MGVIVAIDTCKGQQGEGIINGGGVVITIVLHQFGNKFHSGSLCDVQTLVGVRFGVIIFIVQSYIVPSHGVGDIHDQNDVNSRLGRDTGHIQLNAGDTALLEFVVCIVGILVDTHSTVSGIFGISYGIFVIGVVDLNDHIEGAVDGTVSALQGAAVAAGVLQIVTLNNQAVADGQSTHGIIGVGNQNFNTGEVGCNTHLGVDGLGGHNGINSGIDGLAGHGNVNMQDNVLAQSSAIDCGKSGGDGSGTIRHTGDNTVGDGSNTGVRGRIGDGIGTIQGNFGIQIDSTSRSGGSTGGINGEGDSLAVTGVFLLEQVYHIIGVIGTLRKGIVSIAQVIGCGSWIPPVVRSLLRINFISTVSLFSYCGNVLITT